MTLSNQKRTLIGPSRDSRRSARHRRRPRCEGLEGRTLLATSPFELSSLLPPGGDGSQGFILNGIAAGDRAAFVSEAGDVNGDGIDDLIIGASEADPSGDRSGQAYVVFGKAGGHAPAPNLDALDGTNGFTINPVGELSLLGTAVSAAGDVNNDGIGDLIVGAPYAAGNARKRPGDLQSGAGEAYVIFGRDTVAGEAFASVLNVGTLDGTNGFTIKGMAREDRVGRSVSVAGDVNGDGIDDIVIGSLASPNRKTWAGQTLVVFGKNDQPFPTSVDPASLDGKNGFVINGIGEFDSSGKSVAAADVNGDGLSDVIIGASGSDVNAPDSGQSYVVFGRPGGFPSAFELSSLDGNNGFMLNGIAENDQSGGRVGGAGDVNGDGIDDLVIGADLADPEGIENAGQIYLVFGKSGGFAPTIELSALDGTVGYQLNGIDAGDRARPAGGVGDLDGDGIGDLIIGALGSDPNGQEEAGESYVLFGDAANLQALDDADGSIDGRIRLSSIDGSNGFVINGIDAGDRSGYSVGRAGDVDGDGIDDLIIGASGADPNGNGDAGEVYVVFGEAATPPPPGNDAPLADDDGPYLVEEDAPLSVAAPGVLANDSDPDNTEGDPNNGQTLTARLDSAPANGSVTLDADGSFTYTPNADFNGTDSFTYRVSDGYVLSDPATVTITVNPVNDAPVADDDSATTTEATPVTVDVLANDTDPDNDAPTVSSVSDPVNGSAVDNGDGTVTYTPDAGFTGQDSFTYTIGDGNGKSDTATVSIDVQKQKGGGKGGGPNKLTAASIAGVGSTATPLARWQLRWAARSALTLWRSSGADLGGLGRLTVRVADLPGTTLGQAEGRSIVIDRDAAGWGWFADPTPGDASDLPAGRMDLITAIAHEIGHALGHDHDHEDDVMAGLLDLGTRRLPGELALDMPDSRRSRRG